MKINIIVADESYVSLAENICACLEQSAAERKTGIARRDPDYIRKKISEGKAVIAFYEDEFAGFCYIESWSHEKYVANSGLYVVPRFRKYGIGLLIKEKIFELSRTLFPQAKIFGITTSLAVMKINSKLGYEPVTFSELTNDPLFWKGCISCRNHHILISNDNKMCLCTGMLYEPFPEKKNTEQKENLIGEL